jgi:hypothetical protein
MSTSPTRTYPFSSNEEREWYRSGHDLLVEIRRALLLDNELNARQWSNGLRKINSIEMYLLRRLHDWQRINGR